MMKKLHSYQSTKAFTLLEVLISVVILVIIFIYIYGSYNITYTSTQKMKSISENVIKREKIISLFYTDFMYLYKVTNNSTNTQDFFVVTPNTKFDKLDLKTRNSLFGITIPNVKYRVIQSNSKYYLIRTESFESYEISTTKDFYRNVLIEDIEYFKVDINNEANEVEVYIKAKDMKDIYLKIKGLS